ncbi:histidine phosphatase family protein [Cutibacterium sp.]|uniref:histidine phosphatase family protein n=1 Tax=Cutibacterium sp. TaxID=1912221 RepID=UPI0026DA771E|nr:histidine phosphatase family protein [Cutibacterium sp.]MDO4413250.1 histidine phosphatase family protein [Cutibacterium sp.]
MARLLLIRHGRTPAIAKGILVRRSDHLLDEVGIRDVKALASQLTDVAPEVVVTSPASRTQQTAAIVTQGTGWSCPIPVDDDVSECDYRRWAGQPMAWRLSSVTETRCESSLPAASTLSFRGHQSSQRHSACG